MANKFMLAVAGTALLLTPTAASAWRNMYCDRSGRAYIVTAEPGHPGIYHFTPAGGCAGGPWTISLSLVLNDVRETDWRRDRFLRGVYQTLQRIPDRPPRWFESARLQRTMSRLRPRGRFAIRPVHLPRHVARLLAERSPGRR